MLRLFFIFFILLGCKETPSQDQIVFNANTASPHKKEDAADNYAEFLRKWRKSMVAQETTIREELVFEAFRESLPKYWLGTDWDFNGTTRTPQKGSIACGYFVTNILDDLGMPLQRVYLAQQPSSVMIKKLSKTHSIKRFAKADAMKNELIKNYPEKDILIVGLDFHTGFLIKEGHEIYFFHADYVSDQVQWEKLENSKALNSSNSFMIGSILQNISLF